LPLHVSIPAFAHLLKVTVNRLVEQIAAVFGKNSGAALRPREPWSPK
jgi:hypothetical protein